MKRINVNAHVYLNTENPTPSRTDRLIAINVVPASQLDKRIIENYVLAIDDYSRCCEDYGAEYQITDGICKRGNIEDMGKVFLKSIDTDVGKPYGQRWKWENEEDYYTVRLNTDKGTVEAYVYNKHNGYYSHHIYYRNDELKISVEEKGIL